jgi:hypothetical protein
MSLVITQEQAIQLEYTVCNLFAIIIIIAGWICKATAGNSRQQQATLGNRKQQLAIIAMQIKGNKAQQQPTLISMQ